jgi:hypothetical protein
VKEGGFSQKTQNSSDDFYRNKNDALTARHRLDRRRGLIPPAAGNVPPNVALLAGTRSILAIIPQQQGP